MIIFLAGLVLSIPLAHLIAWLLTRSRRVSPGNVHEIMPVLPASRPIRGSAERRWNAQINRTEAALIRRFSNGVQGAEATQLAGQLGIDAEVVEEALAKLREEIPCRLRITAQGRMLHDFEAKDISTLQARRARSWPLRALIFVLAAFANIGAAWPVIGLGLGAALTLLAMFSGPEEERLIVGLTGLFLLAVFFVVNLIAGWVIHLVLTPVLISGPRLGDLTESEEPRKRTRRSASNTGGGGGGGLWFWGGDVAANSWGRSSSSGGGSWFSGGGSSSSSGGDSDGDGIGEAILVIIVVVVLLMIIAATATVFVVWLRGLWRSLTRREEAGDISPSDWVRMADTIDWSERYLPTNDLVLRTSRALGRTFRHRRPQDTDMGARALLLAKRHNGVVSALDLVLYEGLDQSEAIELGVRLCALAQGQIRMTDEGDMAFAFPARILGDLEGTLSDDMEAEYIDLKADHTWARRPHQPEGRAPVNVVGLTRGHLVASDRLVAGTFSMAAIGVLTLAGVEAHVVLQLLGGAGCITGSGAQHCGAGGHQGEPCAA
ncbi:MAG: hypothetical protein AAFX99_35190, partial [Myxococcota bacterium]